MLLSIAVGLVGLALLTKAADEFVVGAARLSALLRVSPIVIGAVIIGFGTSSPELFVSALAAAQGDIALGVGNIVGSNIANLSLILGVAAVLVPFSISSKVVRREAPLSLAAGVVFTLTLFGGLSVVDGLILAVVLVLALAFILRDARVSADLELVGEVKEFVGDEPVGAPREVVRTVLGLLGTLVGAQGLVWGATRIAEDLGLSEGFIGLTLVAVGTSLPELVTTIQAARRREDELIVGNLLGSNIFNSLAVGASVAFLGAGTIGDDDLLRIAAPLMLAVMAVAMFFMWTRLRLERWEGVTLMGTYGVSVAVLAA